jgi:hypothetical protein
VRGGEHRPTNYRLQHSRPVNCAIVIPPDTGGTDRQTHRQTMLYRVVRVRSASCQEPAHRGRRRGARQGMALGEFDECTAEIEDYAARANRWASEASVGLHDVNFWRTMVVAHVSRQPTSHLQHWFQERTSTLNSSTRDVPKIVELVCRKADSIAQGWDVLLNDSELYSSWGDLLNLLSDASEDERSQWIAKAVLACLEIRADFHLRTKRDKHKHSWPYPYGASSVGYRTRIASAAQLVVVEVRVRRCRFNLGVRISPQCFACRFSPRILNKVRTFPYLLFWLVWKPWDVVCLERQVCAKDLIEMPVAHLKDSTVLKLRVLFELPLRRTAESGLLHPKLWRLLRDVAEAWRTDTQEIEGTNNMLKHILGISPGIKWQLLSARITTKKHCIPLSSKDARDEFIRECADRHEVTTKFASSHAHSERWNLLDQEEFHYNPPPPKDIVAAVTAPTPDEVCSAKLVALFLKRMRLTGLELEPSATEVVKTLLFATDSPVVTSVLIPALKHYSTFWVAHALVSSNDDEDDEHSSLQMPLHCSSLIRAMLPLHQEVVASWEGGYEDSDLLLCHSGLRWDRGSFQHASVLPHEEIVRLSSVCRCLPHKRIATVDAPLTHCHPNIGLLVQCRVAIAPSPHFISISGHAHHVSWEHNEQLSCEFPEVCSWPPGGARRWPWRR